MKKMSSENLRDVALEAAKKLEADLTQHVKPGTKLKVRTGLKGGSEMMY